MQGPLTTASRDGLEATRRAGQPPERRSEGVAGTALPHRPGVFTKSRRRLADGGSGGSRARREGARRTGPAKRVLGTLRDHIPRELPDRRHRTTSRGGPSSFETISKGAVGWCRWAGDGRERRSGPAVIAVIALIAVIAVIAVIADEDESAG